jgi:predicted nuclease with TOPRIM domain
LVKSKATLSLDPHTYEKAKRTYSSVSHRVEELLEADLDASKIDDKDLLREKEDELQSEIEEINQNIEDLQKEKQEVSDQLKVVKSKIERLEAQEEEIADELERFKQVFKKNDWQEPGEINDYWSQELEKEKQELWNIGQNCVEG